MQLMAGAGQFFYQRKPRYLRYCVKFALYQYWLWSRGTKDSRKNGWRVFLVAHYGRTQSNALTYFSIRALYLKLLAWNFGPLILELFWLMSRWYMSSRIVATYERGETSVANFSTTITMRLAYAKNALVPAALAMNFLPLHAPLSGLTGISISQNDMHRGGTNAGCGCNGFIIYTFIV